MICLKNGKGVRMKVLTSSCPPKVAKAGNSYELELKGREFEYKDVSYYASDLLNCSPYVFSVYHTV